VAVGLPIRLFDKSSANISFSVSQVMECLDMRHVLFQADQVLDLLDNHTFPGSVLRCFSRHSQSAVSSQGASSHWVAHGVQPGGGCGRGQAICQNVVLDGVHFHEAPLPGYNWRTKFGTLHCGVPLFRKRIVWLVWRSWL
jgi:hypothetical protein